MRSWHWRAWLGMGYLLFYVLLFAQSAYDLPRLHHMYPPLFATELFRSAWFLAAMRCLALRHLAVGLCLNNSHLCLWLLVAAIGLLGLGYRGALREWSAEGEERRAGGEPGGGAAFGSRASRVTPSQLSTLNPPTSWVPELPWPLIRLAALAALPLLLLLPPTSGDYLAYLFAGRVLSVYHLNPWHHPLVQFPAEQSYLSLLAWGSHLECIYGPVWAAVMGLTTGLCHLLLPGDMTFGSLMLNVLLLRAVNLGALIAAGMAIWRINGRLWPRQQTLVTAAFLLNPLVVYETIGALHNDIWGVALLLWACELFLRDDPRFAALLALSTLTKYAMLAMAPFIAICCWRRRDWRGLIWLALALLLALGLTQLTSVASLTQRIGARRTLFLLSPLSLPQWAGVGWMMLRGLPALTGSLVSLIANSLGALFVPLYLTLVWRTRTREQVIPHTLWALALYFTLVYRDSMPWYYLWPLGLLCATRWSGAAANAAWASCAVLFGYILQIGCHDGIDRWDLRLILPGFALAVGLPVTAALIGRRGWSVVGARPGEDAQEEPPGSGRGRSRAVAVFPACEANGRG